MAKILPFVLFLIAFAAWLWLGNQFTKRVGGAVSEQSMLKLLIFYDVQCIINSVGLFVCVYLLSGVWFWQFFLAFIAVAQLGLLLSVGLWAVLGTFEKNVLPGLIWCFADYQVEHPVLAGSGGPIAVLVGIAYLVMASVAYFTHDQSPELTIKILSYTLLMTFFAGFGSLLSLVVALASKNVDEDTRAAILANQFGTTVPTALYLILAFLAFRGNIFNPAESASVLLWLQVFGVLVAFVAVSAIIPYLIGTQRAAKWRADLLQVSKDRWSQLVEIIMPPLTVHTRVNLDAFREATAKAQADFANRCKIVEIAENVEKGIIPNEAVLSKIYAQCRKLDPRLGHRDDMQVLQQNVEMACASLEPEVPPDERTKACDAWARRFERQEEKVKEREKREEKASPAVKVIWSLVGVGVSAGLSSIGKALWETLSKSVFG